MGVIAEILGQERLLDVARDPDFLLEALALAFALHQARVIENACGVGGQRVENLPVQLGKCRWALRVKVQHAEKFTTRYVRGRLAACARRRVQRNHDNSTQPLGYDASR